MKMSDIKDLSLVELKRRLADEQESLGNLRFQLSTSQLESPIKVRTIRRDIARIKTLIRVKQESEAAAQQPVQTEARKS
jgi:large subunit ribosomal protein L29